MIKKICIDLFIYFVLINSNYYENNNLDKKFPYNGLEHYISSLRNGGNTFLMGKFNAWKPINQAILFIND